jgi:phage gpG-like protein
MSMTVTKDNTAAVLQTVQNMARKLVLIGIPASAPPRDGEETNAAIGFLHEHGSPVRNIPARPFLKPGMEQAAKKCAEVLGKFAKSAFDNPSDIDKGLSAAGLIAQTSVKKRIVSGEGFAPLSDRTLAERAAKGAKGTKPLIRTGQLLNSITYVVRENNGSD